MSNTISPEIQNKETVARFLWTGLIIMFFVIQAIIWTLAIMMTSNDSSHAMVTGFDARISAEERDQKERSSKNLGWHSKLTVANTGDASAKESANVILNLQDRDGQPISIPSIELRTFHCGQAALVQEVDLMPTKPGIYAGEMRLHKTGNWQFNSEIKSGEQVFLLQDRQYLSQ